MDNKTVQFTLFVVAIVFFVYIFAPIDEHQLTTRYLIRGALPADTNIVLVYLDSDDIQALGGWPLQRNYYALMINQLHGWGAQVIGLDILLDHPSATAPEYDTLLIQIAEQIPSIVAVAYGRQRDDERITPKLPDHLLYRFTEFQLTEEMDIVAPFEGILNSIPSIGHTNYEGGAGEKVPLFINSTHGQIGAFSLEVFRNFKRIEKEDIIFKGRRLLIESDGFPTLKIPIDSRYRVSINHLGPVDSFQRIRFPSLLKDDQQARILRELLRGKIVLVGIIAEGRGSFITTPFTGNLPSLAYHATIIDNFLKERFLRHSSFGFSLFVSLIMGLCGIFIARLLVGVRGLLMVLFFAILYIGINIFIFNHFSFVLPLLAPLVSSILGGLIVFVLFFQSVQSKLDVLSKEKETIIDQLKDRETRLQYLQDELERARQKKDTATEEELLHQVREYQKEIRHLKTQIDDTEVESALQELSCEEYEGIFYTNSEPMKTIVSMLEKVAPTDAPVLLLGESGTGKELAARAIHNRSHRRNNPFVAVHCGALSETLLESELFGHERGAFTGAVTAKLGRFELADKGTIFLDEIADTSEAFQVKLLRVLQEGTFERVGGTETKKVDVRVIAATNRDISTALNEKKFREDLYYRLNVFVITLPPIRERSRDLMMLISSFLKKYSTDLKVSRLALQTLQSYHWPGNVRELQAAIQRAALLASSEKRSVVRLHDLPGSILETQKKLIDIADQILEEIRSRNFSRDAITQTARELGNFNRGTIAEYMRGITFDMFVEEKYDIKRTAHRLAGSQDGKIVERAHKKLIEYLSNIAKSIDRSKPIEEIHSSLKSKYKKLPQRFHPALTQIINAYYNRFWEDPSTK